MKTSNFTAVEQIIKHINKINVDLGHLRNTGRIQFHEAHSGQIRLELSSNTLFNQVRDTVVLSLRDEKTQLITQLLTDYDVEYDGE